ncbi:general secretion pathway protein H [Thiothrix nivea DSM 5205]|uniref:Type II secretion system protein H n=2 Tax=Thiothrix nivea TaxID=1031 RepID=A0A656HL04_THINJ|nr:general secretion pathway protein H [Thiothrix nivea DSM 5205]
MVLPVAKVKMQILLCGNSELQNPSPHPLSFKGRGGKNTGFTLLEVLIVLVIGGLLMGVVATSLSEGPVLRKSSREVAASLRHARAMAVMRQQPALWKMNIKDKHFWIEGGEPNSERTFSAGITAKINTTSSEVNSADQGGIRFFPDGSSTGGSVELTYNQQTYKVNVEWVTGRVSVQ